MYRLSQVTTFRSAPSRSKAARATVAGTPSGSAIRTLDLRASIGVW
jgi:hypothetical protein